MQEVAPSLYWTCVKLYLWGLNYSRAPSVSGGKSSTALAFVQNLARRGTKSWALRQVWLVAGSIWAPLCNSRPNPRVHPSQTRGGHGSHIDLPSFSQRRGVWGGGQEGDISTTLQCIMKGWYRISFKLTEMSFSRSGKKTLPRWCLWLKAGV